MIITEVSLLSNDETTGVLVF